VKVPVYVEKGDKKLFASAVAWPGWSRSGKTEEDALAALLAAGPRYAKIARRADRVFEPPGDVGDFEIVERLKGGGGTDFGVPGLPAGSDDRPIKPAELKRLRAILEGSWAAFDRAAKAADGVELRKGPRGGGRDLDKIVGHAFEADGAYVVQSGGRYRPTSGAPPAREWLRLRKRLLEVLEARARNRPVENPANVRNPWLPRYLVRRTAWHVLDHAWEIEDRAAPEAAPAAADA
jgi:hypothetical protein